MEQKAQPNNPYGKRIEGHRQTSPCETSVLNLGKTPRLSGNFGDSTGGSDPAQLPELHPRKILPSHAQASVLLSMAVGPEERDAFDRRFNIERNHGKEVGHVLICDTTIRWATNAFQCPEPTKLECTSAMFARSGTFSKFLTEFYIMDAVLNHSVTPAMVMGVGKKGGMAVDPDVVVMSRAYDESDLYDQNDHKYRTMILFLPQCGVFYCARKRLHGDVGLLNSLVSLDMSWLRLQRDGTVDTNDSGS